MGKFNKYLLCAILLLGISMVGCAEVSRLESTGHNFKVTLYSASGTQLGQWVSEGRPDSENGSDGYYFRDNSTKRVIEISGTVINEELP